MIFSLTQVAWAPGVGIKESAFRKLCNIELGVTYIPWEKAPDNLDPLLDGGVLDEDSIPQDFAGTDLHLSVLCLFCYVPGPYLSRFCEIINFTK